MQLASSNPILADSALQGAIAHSPAVSTTCTVNGVINKTIGCVLLAVLSGAIAVPTAKAFPSAIWIAFFVSLGVSILSIFMVRGSPRMAATVAVLYSAAQGFMLGALGMVLQTILDAQQIAVPGGIALQAFIIVFGLMIAMLTLFRMGLITGGRMFQAGLSMVTLGIGIMFLIGLVMSLFGAQVGFLAFAGAGDQSTTALIGLGINAVVLVVAALWLIVDFRQIEDAVASGAPASIEWYLAFGLIVTLAWVYLEALKLVFRLAMMFGGRRD
jgi:uncharacterized YccA/Bax inhibitor family protein